MSIAVVASGNQFDSNGIQSSFVTSVASGFASGQTFTIQGAANGDTVFLIYTIASTTQYLTALSSANTTWDQMGTRQTIGGVTTLQIWRGKVSGGAGGTSVTATLNATLTTTGRIEATEFSGIDQSVVPTFVNTSGTSATHTTSSVTPTAGANVLLFAAVRAASGAEVAPGSPYVAQAGIGTGVVQSVYQVVTSASGSYNAAFTGGNVAFANFMGYAPGAANQPPTASITSPANNAHYTAGASIAVTGTGSDAEDGTLTGASLTWDVDGTATGDTGVSATLTGIGNGTHVIGLTATDSLGASTRVTKTGITLQPADIQITASPYRTQRSKLYFDVTLAGKITTNGFTADTTPQALTVTITTTSGSATLSGHTGVSTSATDGTWSFPNLRLTVPSGVDWVGTITVTTADLRAVTTISITCKSTRGWHFFRIPNAAVNLPPLAAVAPGSTGTTQSCDVFAVHFPPGFDPDTQSLELLTYVHSTGTVPAPGQRWNGVGLGVDIDGTGQSGNKGNQTLDGGGIADMLNTTDAQSGGTLWSLTTNDGRVVAAFQYSDTAGSGGATPMSGLEKDAVTARQLEPAMYAEMARRGVTWDANKVKIAWASNGALIGAGLFYLSQTRTITATTPRYCAALGGGFAVDPRVLNLYDGGTFAFTPIDRNGCAAAYAARVKGVPMWMVEGGTDFVLPVSYPLGISTLSTAYARELRAAFDAAADTAEAGGDYDSRNLHYTETDSSGANNGTFTTVTAANVLDGGFGSHGTTTTYGQYVAAILRDFLGETLLNRVAPTATYVAPVTNKALTGLGADVAGWFGFVTITDNLLKTGTGGVQSTKDVVFFNTWLGAGHQPVQRLRAYRIAHDTTAGIITYKVRFPKKPTVATGDVVCYCAICPANATDFVKLDGHLADDATGVLLTVASSAAFVSTQQTVDRDMIADGTGGAGVYYLKHDWAKSPANSSFVSGAPAHLGGQALRIVTGGWAQKLHNPYNTLFTVSPDDWQNDLSNIPQDKGHALAFPHLFGCLFKPNVNANPILRETLMGYGSSQSSSAGIWLSRETDGTILLRGPGTLQIASSNTVDNSAWNTIFAILDYDPALGQMVYAAVVLNGALTAGTFTETTLVWPETIEIGRKLVNNVATEGVTGVDFAAIHARRGDVFTTRAGRWTTDYLKALDASFRDPASVTTGAFASTAGGGGGSALVLAGGIIQ